MRHYKHAFLFLIFLNIRQIFAEIAFAEIAFVTLF